MKKLFLILLVLIATDYHGLGQNNSKIEPIDVGSRLELFVDSFLIDQIKGDAKIQLHHPVPQEIVMVFDEPWEGSGCGFRSIFKDGDKYKMYYESWHHESSRDLSKVHPRYHAYAESYDGVHWFKPNLGIYDFGGNKNNNIVFISGKIDGFNLDAAHCTVLMDENPNVEPDEKFKAFILSSGEKRGLVAYKSGNGINWQVMDNNPVITNGAFDSQNLAFWDPNIGAYRAYWRYFDKGTEANLYVGNRGIRTAISHDFINWKNYKDLEYENSPIEELYTNQIKPYYRAPHIYMGFPMRYIERGWSESMRALPELDEREFRASESLRYGVALTETLFMTSRDGNVFNRWNEGYIRPGIERDGSWTYGDNLMGWQVIETKSSLSETAPNELSMYVTENYWKGLANSLRRYTLRIDGFVSVSAPVKGGELITKLIQFEGNKLHLNFSSSASGDILVEFLDRSGKPVPGYSTEECDPVFGDSIDRIVSWNGNDDISSLKNRAIKIRFIIKDADLYSFKFQN